MGDGHPVTRRYTSDGRRISSMTHARRGHECEFCSKLVYGNGGKVSHARSHVRRGEVVELVKHFPTYPPMSNRVFVDAKDSERIARYERDGYRAVTP